MMIRNMVGKVSRVAGRGVSAVSNMATKLSPLQKDKKSNFEDIAIKNFNACLDDLSVFKQAVNNNNKELRTLDTTQFSERDELIHHMVNNPSLYNIHKGRLEAEVSPSGIDLASMDQFDVILYGLARFYAIESSGCLEYYQTIKESGRMDMNGLHESRAALLASYTLALTPALIDSSSTLSDNARDIVKPMEPKTIYLSLPPNEDQSISFTILDASGKPRQGTIAFTSLSILYNPDITFETLKLMAKIIALAARIPEIDSITQDILKKQTVQDDLERKLDLDTDATINSLRRKINTLLPLRIAFDKINDAFTKGNVPEDLKPIVIKLLDAYRNLTSRDLSEDTSKLLDQLTEIAQRIEEYLILMVSRKIDELIVDVETRSEAEKPVEPIHVIPRSRPKPPQYTSNAPIDWEKETIDISNHFVPFAGSEPLNDGPSNQEPPTPQDTNENSTWMIMACLIGGTVLIAACVALVVLSHGGAAPIGIAGIVIGANIISAAAGALGTLGLFGLGASYGIAMYSNDGAPRITMTG